MHDIQFIWLVPILSTKAKWTPLPEIFTGSPDVVESRIAVDIIWKFIEKNCYPQMRQKDIRYFELAYASGVTSLDQLESVLRYLDVLRNGSKEQTAQTF